MEGREEQAQLRAMGAEVLVIRQVEDLLKALFDALTVLQADGTQKKIYEQYKLDPALILPIAIQR